ncbi:MAG TPA: tetratricopeptide repeat protein [Clostridia bacterium]|nr:tetratricopeptide repeat protein [Clostridia bacterium]
MASKKRLFVLLLLAASIPGFAQTQKNATPAAPTVDPGMRPPTEPATPTSPNSQKVESGSEPKAPEPVKTDRKVPNRASAYYHYTLAHMYEEMLSTYGRSEYANKAIEEYRLAIENDPSSEYLNAGLAELYVRTGRIRDAVLEAQEILKRDPDNVEAHKLLGRIYLRSLGDMQAGTQSQNILKLAIEQYEAIVKIDPKSVEDHLLLGRLYRLNNELAKAESEFKTAVALQPNSEEAVSTLAYLYNEEGDSARAQAILESIPESERTAKVYAGLGYTYEQKKDYKHAIEAYKKAVELDKDNLDSLRGLAQNLMNDGQVEAALEQYNLIAEADPQDAQTYMRIAEIHRRDGKFDLAFDALKRAQAIVPDSLEVPYNLAVISEAMGKYDEAAQTLQQLLQRSEKPDGSYTPGERNNRSVFLERLGTIYREINKTQLAVDTFRKMISLGDDNASRAYQQLIETYRDAKQWPQATAAAQEAVDKLPNDRGLRIMLASQLADQGQADSAIAQVRSMIKGTPEDRETWIALAQMYSRLRRWPDAEQAIAKADELSSRQEEKEYVSFVAGSIYERQKKYDQAEASFRRVLAADPRNATALNYLGYMLADRGTRLEEALGYIRKAVQLDPQNGAYLDSLGWAYYKIGNYELAEENLRKAIERMDNDPTVHDHVADLYLKTGRLKLAVNHWERALQEWNKTVSAEVDQQDVAKVQKKLEGARIRLAKQK